MRAILLRFLKVISTLIAIFYLLPVSLQAMLAVSDHLPASAQANMQVVDMASAGLLPAAQTERAARVVVMSVPLSGSPGRFLSHSWIVYKRQGASAWMRYEVLGFASRDSSGALNGKWLDNQPSLNRFAPDGRWFGRAPQIIASAEGSVAAAMIPKIEEAIKNYPVTAGHYRTWPGPNSNTFVTAILRAVPELGATLPPTAVGKDYRRGVFVGWTDSHTGVELNVNGVFSVKLGRVEGVEVNLLTLVAGIDLRQLGLKFPGIGLVGFGNRHISPESEPLPNYGRTMINSAAD